MSNYATVAEVRRFTNISESEFSDTAMTEFIETITDEIDELTGRTWQEVVTVTDEYYDGDGTDLLWLIQSDISEITALAIDDDDDGTYDTITLSTIKLYKEGYLVLTADSEINAFTASAKSVKITYKYGNSVATPAVRQLCILMVAQLLKFDPNRRIEIREKIDRLRRKVVWIG